MQGEKIIYAFVCKGNITKIGITTNPIQRMKALCRIKPYPVKYIYISNVFYDSNYSKEREVHSILSKYRIKGEWFHIDLYKAKKVIDSVCGEGYLSTRKDFFGNFEITSLDYD